MMHSPHPLGLWLKWGNIHKGNLRTFKCSENINRFLSITANYPWEINGLKINHCKHNSRILCASYTWTQRHNTSWGVWSLSKNLEVNFFLRLPYVFIMSYIYHPWLILREEQVMVWESTGCFWTIIPLGIEWHLCKIWEPGVLIQGQKPVETAVQSVHLGSHLRKVFQTD